MGRRCGGPHDQASAGERVGLVQLPRVVRRENVEPGPAWDGEPSHGRGGRATGSPLIRTPRTLPRVCMAVAGAIWWVITVIATVGYIVYDALLEIRDNLEGSD